MLVDFEAAELSFKARSLRRSPASRASEGELEIQIVWLHQLLSRSLYEIDLFINDFAPPTSLMVFLLHHPRQDREPCTPGKGRFDRESL
jgi:hypothetical protein